MNPFLKDGLGENALDKTSQFTGELGTRMRQLIEQAMNQWQAQMSDEDILAEQRTDFPSSFDDFTDGM